MGLVRYYLALSVLIAHFNIVFGTTYYWPTSSYNAVGGFFALSGFLVYSSFIKAGNWKHYLQRRGRRILPAYWFIVLLCAFGFCFISRLPVSEYFSSPQWWKYLIANLSFLNFLAPDLPGVFENNFAPAVNGSLWTMKIEWLLYISVPIVAWIVFKLKNRYTLVFTLIYFISFIYRVIFTYLYETTENEIYSILGRQFLGQLMYFYTGVFIRFKLNTFLKNKWLILIFTVIGLGLTDLLPYGYLIISPVAVSTIVIWLSVVGKWGAWAGTNDNVSYDIYLFHFPIEQLMFYLGLQTAVGNLLSFIITVIATACLACFSWFIIGKPFLTKNRKKI